MEKVQLHFKNSRYNAFENAQVNALTEWPSWSFLILTYIPDKTSLGAIKSDTQFLYCINNIDRQLNATITVYYEYKIMNIKLTTLIVLQK